MNYQPLILTMAIAGSLTLPLGSVSQNPPASTYRPGYWQPVARVDVKQPVIFEIINQAEFKLDYDFSTDESISTATLAPQQKVTLRKQSLPIYLFINPNSSQPNSSKLMVLYQVTVGADNRVITTVLPSPSNAPGHRSLIVDGTGAIYLH